MLFVKVYRAARNVRDWPKLEALEEESRVPLYFPDQTTDETLAGRMQRQMSDDFASYQTDQKAIGGQRRLIEGGLPPGLQY